MSLGPNNKKLDKTAMVHARLVMDFPIHDYHNNPGSLTAQQIALIDSWLADDLNKVDGKWMVGHRDTTLELGGDIQLFRAGDIVDGTVEASESAPGEWEIVAWFSAAAFNALDRPQVSPPVISITAL